MIKGTQITERTRKLAAQLCDELQGSGDWAQFHTASPDGGRALVLVCLTEVAVDVLNHWFDGLLESGAAAAGSSLDSLEYLNGD